MLHKCNVWQTQCAMKALLCTQPAPFPQVGRAPRCRCRRLSAPNKLANCFNTCLQLRKLRHKTVKSLVLFPLETQQQSQASQIPLPVPVRGTLHNPWLHGCCSIHVTVRKTLGSQPRGQMGAEEKDVLDGIWRCCSPPKFGKMPTELVHSHRDWL